MRKRGERRREIIREDKRNEKQKGGRCRNMGGERESQ